MDLFKTREKIYTDTDLKEVITSFNLKGKTVLCHSRLFSLGRITTQPAVERVIAVLQEEIGPEGTLCIPTYTMSAYNNEVFDVKNSKCPTGILGEVARKMPGFKRSIHPIYSTCCWGKNADLLIEKQSPETCFGPQSFFDVFSKIDNSCFLMLGINLSVITMCHYYDQMNNAPGRFVKSFDAEIIDDAGQQSAIKFDSYVKDRDFYANSHTCLARLDALVTELGLINRQQFGTNWIHEIDESTFKKVYEACLKVDQRHFLVGEMDEFVEYYRKDNFQLYHNQLDSEQILKIKQELAD